MFKVTFAAALKPGRVNRVTFSPGPTRFTNGIIYPGLTRLDHVRNEIVRLAA